MSRQTVVFDLGNVLITWDRRLLYEQLIDDPDELQHFLDHVLTLEENAVLDRGTPLADMTADLARRHPDHHELIGAFGRRWPETLGPVIDGSVALLGELTAGDVRCFALSNWGADTFAMIEDRYEFLSWFDGLVISGREGMVKPEPEIFELLCERHDVVPGRAVFIDDSPANVAAAAALGFDTVHFTDPASLRAELEQRDLL